MNNPTNPTCDLIIHNVPKNKVSEIATIVVRIMGAFVAVSDMTIDEFAKSVFAHVGGKISSRMTITDKGKIVEVVLPENVTGVFVKNEFENTMIENCPTIKDAEFILGRKITMIENAKYFQRGGKNKNQGTINKIIRILEIVRE